MLKFEAADRRTATPAERRREIEAWLRRSDEPGFAERLGRAAADAAWRAATEAQLARDWEADQRALERTRVRASGQDRSPSTA